VLVLVSATCGGPPPPGASGAEANSYFPLVRGARWVYALDLGLFRKTEVEVVGEGIQNVEGLEGSVFVMSERTMGEAFGLVERAPTAYVVSQGYLSRYAGVDFTESGSVRLLGSEDPTWLFPTTGEFGATWTQETRLMELPEGGGGRIRWVGLTSLEPSLRVRAGTFADVLKVRIEYHDPSQGEGRLLVYEDYYGRGVGLLKSVTYNEQEGHSQMVEQELVRYEFPAAPGEP
jgi:hypothetical protein